jgi:tetratricopeptide (TPR) repeat protein
LKVTIDVTEPKTPTPSRQGLTAAQAFDMAVALHGRGRLGEAAQVYRAILKLNPQHFGALHYLGTVATAQGAPQEAEQLIRQALALKANSAEAHNDLGIALAALERHDEAVAAYESAVALDGDHVEARNNLGNALHARGRSAEAVVHFERALALRPELADLHNNLANVLVAMERREDAIAGFRHALELRPDFPEARNNLGCALAALDRHAEAVEEYRRAIALNPRYFEAHNNLANALAKLERYAEATPHFESALAIKPDAAETRNNFGNVLAAQKQHADALPHYRRAIELRPDFFEAHNNLGNALAALQRHDEAIAYFDKALDINPGSTDAHCNLADALGRLNRHDEAIAHFRSALAIDPDMPEALAGHGFELMSAGSLDEARAQLERAIELAPHRTDFYHNLSVMRRYEAGDPHLAKMEALAAEMDSLPQDQQFVLHFALGKAYADFGAHEKAFHHLLQGNALKRRQVQYDEAGTFARFARVKAIFTAELLRQKQGSGDPSELPVFIVGMPRSGTTLVEQMLASHPLVFGAGELEHLSKILGRLEQPDSSGTPFPEMVPAMDGKALRNIGAEYLAALPSAGETLTRITDKMPANFRLIGMIRLILPNARIIHLQRNPVDTCLSCFSKNFTGSQSFSYDLAELGRYYRGYEDLMAHWRRVLPEGAMLEVQYEELVADFEPQARRILGYCGLEWDERCLAFHRTERAVRTASFVQVRQPIYGNAVGRWLPYKDMLGPLLEELARP